MRTRGTTLDSKLKKQLSFPTLRVTAKTAPLLVRERVRKWGRYSQRLRIIFNAKDAANEVKPRSPISGSRLPVFGSSVGVGAAVGAGAGGADATRIG